MSFYLRILSLIFFYMCLTLSNVNAVKSDNEQDEWGDVKTVSQAPVEQSPLLVQDPQIRNLTEKAFPVSLPVPGKIVFLGGLGVVFGFLAPQQTSAGYIVGGSDLANNTFLEKLFPEPDTTADALLIAGLVTGKAIPYVIYFYDQSQRLGHKVRRVLSKASQDRLLSAPQYAKNKIPHWIALLVGSGAYLAQLEAVVNQVYTGDNVSSEWHFDYYSGLFLGSYLTAELGVYALTAFENVNKPFFPLRYTAEEREKLARQEWLDQNRFQRMKQVDHGNAEDIGHLYYQVHPDSKVAGLVQVGEMNLDYLEGTKRLHALLSLPAFQEAFRSRNLVSWKEIVELFLNVGGTVGDAFFLQYMVANNWLGGDDLQDQIVGGVVTSTCLLAKLWCERGMWNTLDKTYHYGMFLTSKTAKPARALLEGISWCVSTITPVSLAWYLNEIALPHYLGEDNAYIYTPAIMAPFFLKYWRLSQNFNAPQYQSFLSRAIGATEWFWEATGFANKKGPLTASLQIDLEERMKNSTDALGQLSKDDFNRVIEQLSIHREAEEN